MDLVDSLKEWNSFAVLFADPLQSDLLISIYIGKLLQFSDLCGTKLLFIHFPVKGKILKTIWFNSIQQKTEVHCPLRYRKNTVMWIWWKKEKNWRKYMLDFLDCFRDLGYTVKNVCKNTQLLPACVFGDC